MIDIYKKAVGHEQLQKLEGFEVGSWINLTTPTDEEIRQISELTNVERDVLISTRDPDERPRVEREKPYVSIVFRIPLFETDEFVVIPIHIIVTQKYVVTISSHRNAVLEDLIGLNVKKFFTTKRTRMVVQIFSRTNQYFQRYLDQIQKAIENMEESILWSSKNQEIMRLLKFQKDLIYISTAVVSNEKVIEKILTGKILQLYKEDTDLLEDILIENKESIETVNIYSNILSNTMDAYASIISNNLNIVMKFLATVTIILAIPTIVASFYGMNVSLPFQRYPHAFWLTLLFSAAAMLFAVLVFNKKKFF
ncbi:MAG: magnesium transporter CorA family protein [Candidatus Woesearchaeota archaeon]